MFRTIMVVLTVLLTGMVTGIMLGTGGSLLAARSLQETCWTQSFQQDDPIFARLMVPLFAGALLCLGAATIVIRGGARYLLIASGVLFAMAVVITQLGNVPINMEVRHWMPGVAPGDWQVLRDRWLWLHLARSIAALLSFIASTVALSLRSGLR